MYKCVKKFAMKTVLVTALTILAAYSAVNAQAGMPQNLTCTEQAFNFSVSLGTKWKFSTPKMGPIEAKSYETDYGPTWLFKIDQAAPEADLLPLFQAPSKANGLSYFINRQNQGRLFYPDRFGVMGNPKYLLPVINFGPPINYVVFPPLVLSPTN